MVAWSSVVSCGVVFIVVDFIVVVNTTVDEMFSAVVSGCKVVSSSELGKGEVSVTLECTDELEVGACVIEVDSMDVDSSLVRIDSSVVGASVVNSIVVDARLG